MASRRATRRGTASRGQSRLPPTATTARSSAPAGRATPVSGAGRGVYNREVVGGSGRGPAPPGDCESEGQRSWAGRAAREGGAGDSQASALERDSFYMGLALEEARRAAAADEVPVGAV